MTSADPTTLRLATRGSLLARAQTALVQAALHQTEGVECELIIVQTLGDREQHSPVSQLSGQGWFTAEVERTLAEGRADAGVHSAKDLPNLLPEQFTVAAYLPRADARDALIARDAAGLQDLHDGATVGTSSPRRGAMVLAANPALNVVPMRGNVDTRLAKLYSGEVDALILACAGLDRLGRADVITERLDPRIFVPAPAQGAIAVETAAAGPVRALCCSVDDAHTRALIAAERGVLAGLGGGCLLPLGAWARLEEGKLVLSAALATGGGIRHVERWGDLDSPQALGEAVAADLH